MNYSSAWFEGDFSSPLRDAQSAKVRRALRMCGVQPGERVAVDEPLVELETDKVTIEVPAPAAGVLSEIAAKDGETVAVGALLGQIKEGAGAAAAAPSKSTPSGLSFTAVMSRSICVI